MAELRNPFLSNSAALPPIAQQTVEYWVDAWQRTVLFWDVLRQRSDQYYAQKAKAVPNVLSFEAELLMDGRTLARPVNYGLVRIKPPEVVTIDIDFDGTVLWNGVAIPDRAALEAKLSEAAAAADQPEVHLRPNKLVEYKSVATVLASAQRLGVTKLGLVGNEQFVQ